MAISSLIDRPADYENVVMPSVEEFEAVVDDAPRSVADGDMVMDFADSYDNPDAGMTVSFGDEAETFAPDENELDHDANLASFLSDSDNHKMADELIDMIEADEESMKPWRDKMKRGLEVMGVVLTNADELPFDGASCVVHPMIAEAVVQFNARSVQELLPPAGPCKGLVMGDTNAEKREQADRIENHMNYQMTEEDAGYYDEIDSLLFYLPLAGSAFTKTYYDDLHFHTTTKFIKAENLVIPYTATSLQNSPRYSIIEMLDKNDIKKRMASGMYQDVTLIDPVFTDDDEIKQLYDDAEGRDPSIYEDDPQHRVYEVNIEYDLPGFEDEDGIALPYIISVDADSRQILSVRRNWKQGDENKVRRHYVTPYKYLPGFGVLGFGLVHVLGGLAEACTGSMRALLDSAAFATLQGGFKSKDARFPAGEHIMRPGEWSDVDMSAEELSSAFYTPPFKEPSRALFQMLDMLEENGRRFAGTTEAIVGDASNSGPVGTTVALIEQGSKVMSGIHRRLHRSQRAEFKIRAEINAEFLPEGEEIYYDNSDDSSFISTDDYTNRHVNAVPVSDPNITSATQRIAQAQALQQRADERPDLYRAARVEFRLLQALDVDDAEQYIRDPEKKQRCDAIGEGSRLMTNLPIFAYQDQDHAKHLSIHLAQIEYYKTLPEEKGSPLVMAMTEHLAKHEAYRVYVESSQMMEMQGGIPLPELDLYDDDPQEQMPTEIERAVTEQSAMFVQQLMAEIEANKPPPPEDLEAKAKIDREKAVNDEKVRSKIQEHEADMKMEQEKHAQQMRQDQEKFDAQQIREGEDADPNSAQENIMRSLSRQQQAIATLTSIVMPLINMIGQNQPPSNSPQEGVPPNVKEPMPPNI